MLTVPRIPNLELAPPVEQKADRSPVETLVGAPVEQPVIRVERQAGAVVVDARLRNIEVKRCLMRGR